MADQNPAPGWYEDPKDSNCVRWWAGEKWTEATLPNPGTAATGNGGDDANNTDQLDRQRADEKTSTGIASKEAGVEGASGSAAEQRPRREFKKLLLVAAGVSAALLAVLIAVTSGGSDQGVQPSDTNDKPALEQTALEVTSPADGQVVKSKTVTFRGTATPGAVVRLCANTACGESTVKARVAADGSWAVKANADLPGSNEYLVEATAPGRQEGFATVEIIRKKTQAEHAAFRKTRAEAKQKRAAAKAAARQKRVAAKAAFEADYKASAKSIPYKQLAKGADNYAGTRAVFRGQVFQIQESYGSGLMLLAVTDEGYGFWTDNVWVNLSRSTKFVEDDIVTVWGPIVGSKSYETQIGGETFVPEMDAKYLKAG